MTAPLLFKRHFNARSHVDRIEVYFSAMLCDYLAGTNVDKVKGFPCPYYSGVNRFSKIIQDTDKAGIHTVAKGDRDILACFSLACGIMDQALKRFFEKRCV